VTGLLGAFAFLTRVPFPRGRAADLGRAAVWFPVVGAVVGLVSGGARALGGLVLDPLPATVLAVLVPILLTGALHEDGLADTADALGAHVTRERRREILDDPRVGTYGGLALVFAVLLPVAALAPLDSDRFLRVVVGAHVVGRCAAVVTAYAVGPARRTSSAAHLDVQRAQAGLVLVVAVGTPVLLAGWSDGLLAVAAASLAAAALLAASLRGLGAINGDTLGAVTKVAEIVTVVVVTAR
jgi:adenosylcobinamide-GDP ribazoletransferase